VPILDWKEKDLTGFKNLLGEVSKISISLKNIFVLFFNLTSPPALSQGEGARPSFYVFL